MGRFRPARLPPRPSHRVASLSTGADSPVSIDSSTARFEASTRRMSPGTRSPSASSTMSPQDHFTPGDPARLAVAYHQRTRAGEVAQCFQRTLAATLLHETDAHDDKHETKQHQRLLAVAKHHVDGTAGHEQQEHGFRDDFPQQTQHAARPGNRQFVWTVLSQALARFDFAQTIGCEMNHRLQLLTRVLRRVGRPGHGGDDWSRSGRRHGSTLGYQIHQSPMRFAKKCTVTQRPRPPGAVSKVTVAPQRSAMRRTMDRPSPLPSSPNPAPR